MPEGVVRLSGSPEEIGWQHGRQLQGPIRTMLGEYLRNDTTGGRLNAKLLARVEEMKPSLPDWYRRELAACAEATGFDENLLLFAQCEGDIRSLGGCTTYVAYGPATSGGGMEIGRNFDYWGLQSPDQCAVILAIVPDDGHAFVSVGWAGILGGWTFFNEKGLFVANNTGGFARTNPRGIPTLILERIIAQEAGSIEEALQIIRRSPRMRGQVLVLGQTGAPLGTGAPDAVVVEYDAETVKVSRSAPGLAFHSSIYVPQATIALGLRNPNRAPTDVIYSAGCSITLHSVAMRPLEHRLWVAHGTIPSAQEGPYVEYDLAALLSRP